jgi:hypothetical protein
MAARGIACFCKHGILGVAIQVAIILPAWELAPSVERQETLPLYCRYTSFPKPQTLAYITSNSNS